MDQDNLYDVKAFHFSIPEIRDLCKAGAPEDELETAKMQVMAKNFWSRRKHPQFDLAPEGWFPAEESSLVARLASIVDFAFEQVPMYRAVYGNAGYERGAIRSITDFERLPILTRKDLNSWTDDDRLSGGRRAADTHFVGTSGSSGQSLKVYYDQNAAIAETYESLFQYCSYLDGVLDPAAWIYNIHMSRGWMSSLEGRYRTFTIAQPASLEAMIRHFEAMRPQILCALPSHLWELTSLGDLSRFGIRAISTNSEQSSRLERDNFEGIFGVPVLDEYSSVELGVIAYESRSGNYQVNRDGLRIELVNPDREGFGRVVATDFRSWVMPLIRYDQGDLAAWADGAEEQELREIQGRADDFFIAMDGRKIPSASLLNLVDILFTSPDSPVLEFRLQQLSPELAQFDYVLREGELMMPMIMQTALQQNLVTVMGSGSVVSFQRRETLDKMPSYKRKKIMRAF